MAVARSLGAAVTRSFAATVGRESSFTRRHIAPQPSGCRRTDDQRSVSGAAQGGRAPRRGVRQHRVADHGGVARGGGRGLRDDRRRAQSHRPGRRGGDDPRRRRERRSGDGSRRRERPAGDGEIPGRRRARRDDADGEFGGGRALPRGLREISAGGQARPRGRAGERLLDEPRLHGGRGTTRPS